MNMRRISRTVIFAAFCGVVAASASAEFRWVPYLNLESYLGRSNFADSDVNGFNGNLVFVPGMRFGEKLSVLPTAMLGYRKSRDVQELAGGGFLTQEQQTRGLSVKGIYVLTPGWKGKLYTSYRQELVKETKDEKWGDGLFDYDKTAVGVEVEREGDFWKSVRLGADYYTTAFPNFQSLATKQYGAEINAGEDVLDFSAMDFSVGADAAVTRKSMLSGYLLGSRRDFSDQKIVKRDGTFSADTRKDMFTYVSLAYRYQLPTVALFHVGVESLAGLDASYALLNSDQHNYDAGRTKFNENYYDYAELGIGPRVNLRFKEKLSVGLSYLFSTRDYADRPVQRVDGTYTADTISSDVTTFRASLGYPLLKGLSLQAQGAWQNADSNMDYETVYRYNYSSSHYFLGISYQL
ncbi:MAG TPA: hypothetical protein P5079_01520 [Elusimicrobiota bacterium]|nr:hypothetical protein [Elusimicrobiota bacterium]